MGAEHFGRQVFMVVMHGSNGGKPYNRASPVEMHPFWCCAPLLLKGSMSLDSQVASLPYESSSFATPGGEVFSPLSI
jgi:hypothetical protein